MTVAHGGRPPGQGRPPKRTGDRARRGAAGKRDGGLSRRGGHGLYLPLLVGALLIGGAVGWPWSKPDPDSGVASPLSTTPNAAASHGNVNATTASSASTANSVPARAGASPTSKRNATDGPRPPQSAGKGADSSTLAAMLSRRASSYNHATAASVGEAVAIESDEAARREAASDAGASDEAVSEAGTSASPRENDKAASTTIGGTVPRPSSYTDLLATFRYVRLGGVRRSILRVIDPSPRSPTTPPPTDRRRSNTLLTGSLTHAQVGRCP